MHDLYPFQREVVELDHNTLVAHQCGLGKTVTAIEVAKQSYSAYPNKPVLVLALKSSFDQWLEEIAVQDPGAHAEIFRRRGSVPANTRYLVTNYETLLHHPTLERMEGIFWSCMVADEAHHIKNRKAKRSKAIKKLVGHRKVALTGTPIEKSPADMWSILNWLHPQRYTSYWRFAQRYTEMRKNWLGYWEIHGPKNLDDMYEKVGPDIHRRTKEQVAEWLPPVREAEIRVPMLDEQQRLYDKLEASHDIVAEVGGKQLIIKNTMAHMLRLQQMSSLPAMLGYDVPGGSGKMSWFSDFMDANPDESILVFSRFRDVAITLAKLYDAPLIIGGQDNSVPKGAPLVFGTIGAMGTALSMGWMDVAVFWDVDWSATNMIQAKERIHRLDSTDSKYIIYLSASSIDSLLLEAVQNKWSNAELVYQYLGGEFNE